MSLMIGGLGPKRPIVQAPPYLSSVHFWFDASKLPDTFVHGATPNRMPYVIGGEGILDGVGPVFKRAGTRSYLAWPGTGAGNYSIPPIPQVLPLTVFAAISPVVSASNNWAPVLERDASGVAVYSLTGVITTPATAGIYWNGPYTAAADQAYTQGVRSFSMSAAGQHTVRTPLQTVVGTTSLHTLSNWTLFGSNISGSQYPSGNWYEILVYQGLALTELQIAEVTLYLQRKWGLP